MQFASGDYALRTVIFLLAFACAMFLASLVAPILIGFAFGETEQLIKLTILASVGVFIAGACMAATMGNRHTLTRNRLLLSMVIIWIALGAIGALPLVIAGGLPVERAIFESVSGLTTTGASTIIARDALPQSILFWRLQLEWIGGFLTLASLFLVLSPLAIGGLPKRAMASEWLAELDGKDAGVEHLMRYVPLLAYYGAASVLVFFAFIASGTKSLEAAHLAMSSIATGGFNPYETGLEERHGLSTLAVMAVVLTLAATSLFWQRYDLSNPFRVIWRNREAWWVFAFVSIITVCYLIAFGNVEGISATSIGIATLIESFFSAASVISTSGHESRPGVIALLPEMLVFSSAFVGAAVFSTASGLKIHRVGAMLVQAFRELSLLIYPSSITPTRIANAKYGEEALVETWPVLVLLLVVLAISVFVLAGGHGTFEASMISAMALLVNAGPLYEAYAPVAASPDIWPEYRDFSAVERIAGCVIMFLGRLEFIAVFAIFNLKYWLTR
jgi:trk/ktr system potassium uptake protein